MQEKSENIIIEELADEGELLLPHELMQIVTDYLPTGAVLSLSEVSKGYCNFLAPNRENSKKVNTFLQHVVCGKHEAVKKIIAEDINILTQKGWVKDCSGRTFKNISGFQLALYYLDKHMWARMIDCLPQNDEGRVVLEKLYSQYQEVETKGVTYKLNSVAVTEKHFNFKDTILKALQTQDNLMNEKNPEWNAIDDQWRTSVGRAQKLIPMHVVYEYCSDELFEPVPQFNAQPKSSTKFYNSINWKNEDWFSPDSKLGDDFAIDKKRTGFDMPAAHATHRSQPGRGPRVALNALTALCEVRTKDFINLQAQLNERLAVDNQPSRPSI